MAKCQKCGRKSLFLKLDNDLLCDECAALKKREEEAEAIYKKAKDAEDLLNEALRDAKTQAQRILEAQEKALREKIKELEPCVNELEEQRDELSRQIDGMKKTIDSLDYRIHNKKELYKSMKYVIDHFVDMDMEYEWDIDWGNDEGKAFAHFR